MTTLPKIFTYHLIRATIRSATPLVMATVAAIIGKQANIMNIGIEGIMLIGAFVGIAAGTATGSWLTGLLGAIAVGVVISAIIGFIHIKYDTNIIVIGVAVNTMALGFTRFLLQRFYGVVGSYAPPKARVVSLPRLDLEFLAGNPVLYSIFSGYALVEFLSFICIALLWFYLYKTKYGLRLRCVGLNSIAAETAGINVKRTKFLAIIASGVFAGIAGAHLSMSYTSMFVEGMTGGRGFIATAAMNFGGGNPVYALLGCLVFGFSDALAMRLQSTGFPSQFVLMIPYVVVVVVLSVTIINQQRNKRSRQLKNLRLQLDKAGVAYHRGHRTYID